MRRVLLALGGFVLASATAPAQSAAQDNAAQDEIARLAASATLTASATIDTDVARVLSAADEALYREIFALQQKGAWAKADARIKQLGDKSLLGYVQHQRYMHPTAYRSAYGELKRWMSSYADHPMASEIYRLALRRRPRKASPPVRPVKREWRAAAPAWELHPDLAADYAKTNRARLTRIEGRVRYLARKEKALSALKEIDRHKRAGAITTRQYDRMRSWIAASLYYQGYGARAKEIAEAVAARNGETAVMSYWIAGLIAFREGELATARDHFAAMAATPYQDPPLRAAAGFWAARAALAVGDMEMVARGLETAAEAPMTFYGQLALAQLGRNADFDWRAPTLTGKAFDQLTDHDPAVRRAAALAQVGRRDEAEVELRWANGRLEQDQIGEGRLDHHLLALASALDLPAAQLDVALAGEGAYLQAGRYPVPAYAPADGFKADRAVLYGLMRQESKFKTDATSRVGARGLMQLMPRTASYIAKDRSLARRKGRDQLYNPGLNLQLGQAYVNYLIEQSDHGDLFDMAAAYNGGPGNLRRWKKAMGVDDALLFIESIPNSESRDFVEKVLTNVWVYRARLGQPAPSRDLVAAGDLPLYEALDQLLPNN